jgi:probable F420-dependent oxidoreductase
MKDIGRVGLWTGGIDALPSALVRDLVQEVEAMGWPCLWRPEATGRDALVSASMMLEATSKAALGPKMLRLAASAADGAHPYFSTPEHTALARETMGVGPMLAPEQMVVIDTDLARAHETAKKHMARYLQLPNYTNNLRRLGFTDADMAGPTPLLIDAVVACGDIDVTVNRVAQHHAAGADHVCIQVLRPDTAPPVAEWRALAEAFSL